MRKRSTATSEYDVGIATSITKIHFVLVTAKLLKIKPEGFRGVGLNAITVGGIQVNAAGIVGRGPVQTEINGLGTGVAGRLGRALAGVPEIPGIQKLNLNSAIHRSINLNRIIA